jgi:hypothetical protein
VETDLADGFKTGVTGMTALRQIVDEREITKCVAEVLLMLSMLEASVSRPMIQIVAPASHGSTAR